MSLTDFASPLAQPAGLYDPADERDACGVAMVCTLNKTPTHAIVDAALLALVNLDHRGATGADPAVGDGAGIMTQIPDAFLRHEVHFALPPQGSYAVGICFLPQDPDKQWHIGEAFDQYAAEEGLQVLGWRDVPVDSSMIGQAALEVMPVFRQVFFAAHNEEASGIELDRRAFCFRKRVEHELEVYFASLSARTITYKGMLTTTQLEPFFPDLSDERFTSALAIVHSRFSTNTFPSWPLAHPFRYVAHNGEINTVKGNRNWMNTRESALESDNIPGDINRIFPICTPGASDSATFDEVVELLHLSGRSLPHAIMMMVPEAWENHRDMDPARRAFYEYHSSLIEPWDGPAAICFTDGRLLGAVQDRNGLRPGRYSIRKDGIVVLASESGVLNSDPAEVLQRGRLRPGRMFLVDTENGRVIDDEEVKDELANHAPYQQWVKETVINLAEVPEREHVWHTTRSVSRRQRAFGYATEDLNILLHPMASQGVEALGSMGTDTPLAVLSKRPRLLFDYFQQIFAQVTNPPLDAIREEVVTSLGSRMGPEGNLLDQGRLRYNRIDLDYPVIDNDQLAKIKHLPSTSEAPYATYVVRGIYRVEGGVTALRARMRGILAEVDQAIEDGYNYIVLSDRDSNYEYAPIPSLLLSAAVQHHLIKRKTRLRAGLIIEAGDVREVHHVALLIGYGAVCVNPYLAMETVEHMARSGDLGEITPEKAVQNLLKALSKGLLKVMSKIGISTVASYRGAQIFEAIGLGPELIDTYFPGTRSRLGGIGLDVIEKEIRARHDFAYPVEELTKERLELRAGGEYKWRRDGAPHAYNPDTVFALQYSTRNKRYDLFKKYSALVNAADKDLMNLRGLFKFSSHRSPIPVEEVEPVSEIVKRFSTGAMSYGSISREAHETLAIAMNNLGAKSNTGEGGEDPERLIDLQRRSAIKQVASGRFGVTSQYLTNADDIQIKMAQGAKPGEGGQLPGSKVYPWVAKTRHSTPGVGLISPPPHHDIYSIEDLAQLIHDVKNANPEARVHVKLVSEMGVGTVAAGVSKAHADVVLISGYDGGTGASPLTSLKHAGGPWELGLAETQQTLLRNGLRDRIVVQVDGQLKTGRDVVVAALLGAEEFGFATAPLVVSGCVIMRVCHKNTCPVGIATQDPELRARFTGKPEYVETFFTYIAEEVREILADLGFRRIQEAVGQVETLDTRDAISHWKAEGLDISPILASPELPFGGTLYHSQPQKHGLEKAIDNALIAAATPALEHGTPVAIRQDVTNVNRTVGTMLGHEVTKRYPDGLPDSTIDVSLYGAGGQSLGAFLPAGINLRLFGAANDYIGKGLSGGRVVVRPESSSILLTESGTAPRYLPQRGADWNVVGGNTIGYGATSGEIFLRGSVGERYCVRNSGATAVVEGVGDHACEYMTGGVAMILGPTGRNVAAGMSGGLAYVLDLDPDLVNPELVDVLPLRARDLDQVQLLLQDHKQWTGSKKAAHLLENWDDEHKRFSVIVPREYQRAVDILEQAKIEGLSVDSDTVWNRIMEASNG